MSFETKGFLSPEMDSFRTTVRGRSPTKPWFELADDMNKLGLDMLKGHQIPLNDNPRLLIGAFFLRTHKSFQAAIILAELGLPDDGNAVLRTAAEGAIALHALAADPNFVAALVGAHQLNQRKLARVALNNPDYRAFYSPEQITQMEATVKEVDALNANPTTRLMEINWADVAKRHCPDLYELLYRLLSTNSTHTNIDTANNQFEVDSGGQIIGLKTRPNYEELAEMLRSACLIFLWAAEPFLRAFPKDGFSERIQAGIGRVNKLQ
jgi:Family of unknown function (DUF5677)